MGQTNPRSLANLVYKDISKMPNHRELSAKGGAAKSLAQRYARVFRKSHPESEAKDETKLGFYAELVSDVNISQLDLLRMAQELYPTLKSEHAKVQMMANIAQIHKLIHGEKIKSENVHHIVDWTKMWQDIFKDDQEDGETETKKGDKETV